MYLCGREASRLVRVPAVVHHHTLGAADEDFVNIVCLQTQALALVTLVLLWRWKKIPEPVVVLGAAVIGLILHSLLHH